MTSSTRSLLGYRALVFSWLLLTAFPFAACHHRFVSKTKEARGPGGIRIEIDDYSERDGAQEARNDIAKGDLRYLISGDSPEWIREFEVLLREKTGAVLDQIAGCLVTDDLERFQRDYNDVVIAYLETRFGAGLIEKLVARARAMVTRDTVLHQVRALFVTAERQVSSLPSDKPLLELGVSADEVGLLLGYIGEHYGVAIPEDRVFGSPARDLREEVSIDFLTDAIFAELERVMRIPL